MVGMPFTPVEAQPNVANPAGTAAVTKQADHTGQSFKVTLNKLQGEQQTSPGNSEAADVKSEEMPLNLLNVPIVLPVLNFVPIVTVAEDNSEMTEVAATDIVPIDIKAGIDVMTADGVKPAEVGAKEGIRLGEKSAEVISVPAVPENKVLETGLTAKPAVRSEQANPVKLEMGVVEKQVETKHQDQETDKNEPRKAKIVDNIPVRQSDGLLMAADGKASLVQTAVDKIINLEPEAKLSTDHKTNARDVTLAAKEAFTVIAAPEKSSTQRDQGFESELFQPALTALTSQQAKPDVSLAAFPDLEPPQPIKDQVLHQIIQKARLISDGAQQEINIQLKPEHLGPLNVFIGSENGVITAKFHTESQQVKHLMEASLTQLKQDLQAQGLKVQHVEVYVGQQGMSFSDFSRRSPNYNLIKTKRVGKILTEDLGQQFTNMVTSVSKYDTLQSAGVDYKV